MQTNLIVGLYPFGAACPPRVLCRQGSVAFARGGLTSGSRAASAVWCAACGNHASKKWESLWDVLSQRGGPSISRTHRDLQAFVVHIAICRHLLCTWRSAGICCAHGDLQAFVVHMAICRHLLCTWRSAGICCAHGGLQAFVVHMEVCRHLLCTWQSAGK